MYLSVKNVVPQENYTLLLTFENDEKRQFDVKPYLNTGLFRELRSIDLFNTVRVCFDTIELATGDSVAHAYCILYT